ncbi:MAG: hypothetical protein ABFC88_02430 [Thermoguttaceae bacterium]
MAVEAVLITTPAIDFTKFLSLTYEAMGYSIASTADSSGLKMVDTAKFLYCLAALKNESAEIITANLLCHLSFSILVIAEERDLLEILEMTSGMSFVRAETTAVNVDIAVITGTLLQWKDAVVSGTSEATAPTVRTCYSKILLLFDRVGLTSVWQGYDRTTAPDRSGLLLEDMRR